MDVTGTARRELGAGAVILRCALLRASKDEHSP